MSFRGDPRNAELPTALAGRDSGNDLATIAPIDSKIAIEREHDALLIEFRHSDQACIGKRHRHVCELLDQWTERGDLRSNVKMTSDDSARDQRQDRARSPVRVPA